MSMRKPAKVREWGEYILYGDSEVRVAVSYRMLDEKDELVSTGIEWEAEELRPGERHEEAIQRARKRIEERINRLREKIERERGERP